MGTVTQTFAYTGAIQFFKVPLGTNKINCYLWGGGGGGGLRSNKRGGGGGFCQGTILVNEGDQLAIIVGGGGNRGGSSNNGGGWGGDATYGNGYGGRGNVVAAPGVYGGGGGGMSAITRVSDLALLIAAGGGGGAGVGLASGNSNGGGGGGADGLDGDYSGTGYTYWGRGGGHTAGGDVTNSQVSAQNGKEYSTAESRYGGGGGGGGWLGAGSGIRAASSGPGFPGGGGNSGADGDVLDYATLSGAYDGTPGGTSNPFYSANAGWGGDGVNGANRVTSGNWDGQNGQITIEYVAQNFTTVNRPPIALPCMPICIPLLKER